MPESQIGYLDVVTREALALLPGPSVILSSARAGWEGIVVEQFRLPPLELQDNVAANHLLTLKLSAPSRLDWKEGSRSPNKMFCPGDVCVTPSQALRRLRWEDNVELLVIALDPTYLLRAARDLPRPQRIELLQTHGEPDPQIQFIGLALKAELESGGAGGRLFADSLATGLAAHLLSRYNGFPFTIPDYPRGLSSSEFCRVIEYIQDNLHVDLSLTDLANVLQMSTTRFKASFKQSAGMPPHQYIIEQRVERARQSLTARPSHAESGGRSGRLLRSEPSESAFQASGRSDTARVCPATLK